MNIGRIVTQLVPQYTNCIAKMCDLTLRKFMLEGVLDVREMSRYSNNLQSLFAGG